MTLALRVDALAGAARATTITTARGVVRTPCFMPVGTRGGVRGLSTADLDDLGVEVMLANTYHLMLRPGTAVVAGAGGLHRFSAWSGHVLTDSGGFQVFSLAPQVDDEGVTFRSVYDGSLHRLTPEAAVAVQEALGADIAMVLDVCPPLPSPRDVVREAVERTAAWAARCKAARRAGGQAMFGIVQGGIDAGLRADSARRTVDVGFDGYAVGGLSVGEPRAAMLEALEVSVAHLPAGAPRYLMGVGDPLGMVEAIARGVDLFDCVLPTRLGRHGTILTTEGRFHLANARFARDEGPLDASCGCSTCARWSRAYLRHLLAVRDPVTARLLSIHNVWWTLALAAAARKAIVEGTFAALRLRVAEAWPG